ncbi:RICIN domain-containing protein [Paenibacillus glycanilyticus]|uniref:RICIN domain-containing protein n=1 Tax=Paenibacillus glycanilyticus TaxID=126569 RepID=UPI00203EAF1F|nr:RICIN domain-containing protein [Paenibacillus glycanilyticus]MCM3626826.1 RICIN domain-containing protein [Paenibacillus glycanilyticus]
MTNARRSTKLFSLFMAALFILSSAIVVQPAHAASNPVTIINNTDKLDTDGNAIWAQGGWVMKEEGDNTYYWYGMDFETSGLKKINVYTSADMKNWTGHEDIADFSTINPKLVATNDPTPQFAHSQWVGRPLVKYNAILDKYVLFAEWGNGDGNRNKIAIFTSDSATGPFTYEKYISRPGGNKMGDLGSIFTDSDGSTYLTYTNDTTYTNDGIQIAKLTADFMNVQEVTKQLMSTGPYKEATSLYKYGSKYMMMASRTNGWSSSETYCYSATSLSGTWSSPYQCATSPYSGISFDTQIDQVLPIQGTEGTMYMFIGDTWNKFGGTTGVGRNKWYPLTFDGNGNPTINGYAQWNLDAAAGTWSPSSLLSLTQTFALVNRNSGKALSIVGNSASDGGLAEQRPYTGAGSQYWKLVEAGSGYYYIQNTNTGKVLEITDSLASDGTDPSTKDGTQASQRTLNGNANQKWELIGTGDGYYKLKNANSGKVLGMSGGSTGDGAPVIQWAESGSTNQNWSLAPVAHIDLTKTYSITNLNSLKALGTVNNSAGDGAQIEQRTYSADSASQKWQFEYADGYYKIKNANSGKYISNGASASDNANCTIWTGSASTAQQWVITDAYNGSFEIKSRNSSKYLTISNESKNDGALSIQFSETAKWSQGWILTDVNP